MINVFRITNVSAALEKKGKNKKIQMKSKLINCFGCDLVLIWTLIFQNSRDDRIWEIFRAVIKQLT